jgi:hypothetical protein
MRAGRRCGGCWCLAGGMSKAAKHDGALVTVELLQWGWNHLWGKAVGSPAAGITGCGFARSDATNTVTGLEGGAASPGCPGSVVLTLTC